TGIARPTYNIVPCFACGATYIYRGRRGDLNGRFCSMRCQGAYDAGFTPQSAEQPDTLIGWRVVAGGADIGDDYNATLSNPPPIPMKRTADGFKIACAGCSKEFESKGLRCCSDKCESRYRERQANIALMAEVGIEPARKRPCAAPGCSSTI